jgi:hypothetical protein
MGPASQAAPGPSFPVVVLETKPVRENLQRRRSALCTDGFTASADFQCEHYSTKTSVLPMLQLVNSR